MECELHYRQSSPITALGFFYIFEVDLIIALTVESALQIW